MLSDSWQLIIAILAGLSGLASLLVRTEPKTILWERWHPHHLCATLAVFVLSLLIGLDGNIQRSRSKKAAAEQAKHEQLFQNEQIHLQSVLDTLAEHDQVRYEFSIIWNSGSAAISGYLQCAKDADLANFADNARASLDKLVELAKLVRTQSQSLRSEWILPILAPFLTTDPDPFVQIDEAIVEAERLLVESSLSPDVALQIHSLLKRSFVDFMMSLRRELTEARAAVRRELAQLQSDRHKQ